MTNKQFNFGPILLTNTLTTNLLNPATATGGVNSGSSPMYIILRKLRVVNVTAAAATVSLWKGATGGNVLGTEFQWNGQSVPAHGAVEVFGASMRFDSTQFLVGGSDTANALVIEGQGEIGVSG